MRRLIGACFSAKNEFLQQYKVIAPHLGVMQMNEVIKVYRMLQSHKALDQEKWARWEELFTRNISRINSSDLTSISALITNSKVVTKRFCTLFEYKAKSELRNMSQSHIIEIAQHVVSENRFTMGFRRNLLTKIDLDTPVNNTTLLKLVFRVSESNLNDAQLIHSFVQLVYDRLLMDHLTTRELTLYLNIFYTPHLHSFLARLRSCDLSQVFAGIPLPPAELKPFTMKPEDQSAIHALVDAKLQSHSTFDEFQLLVQYMDLRFPPVLNEQLATKLIETHLMNLTTAEINKLGQCRYPFANQLQPLLRDYVTQFAHRLSMADISRLLDNPLLRKDPESISLLLGNLFPTDENPQFQLLFELQRQLTELGTESHRGQLVALLERKIQHLVSLEPSDGLYALRLLSQCKPQLSSFDKHFLKVMDLVSLHSAHDVKRFLIDNNINQ